MTFQNNLALGGSRTIFVNAAAAYPATISGIVSGGYKLTKSGPGMLVLEQLQQHLFRRHDGRGGSWPPPSTPPSAPRGLPRRHAAITLGDATTTSSGYARPLSRSGGYHWPSRHRRQQRHYRRLQHGGLVDAVSTSPASSPLTSR